jgi:carbon monoxide dehydrogenase subunit G
MQLEQRFELPALPATVWAAFKDIGLLVDCLPGASLSGPAVDGELPLRFDVKLGPIAAAFAGSGRVSFDDAARQGRFEGSASDRRTQSRVKGAAQFTLEPGGAGTVVQVRVDYALTGSLAQFSRGGIVRELAGALTSQFANNLAASLGRAPATPTDAEADAASQPPTGHTAASSPVPAARPGPAQPLSAFALVAFALKARWLQLMRRLMQMLRGRQT